MASKEEAKPKEEKTKETKEVKEEDEKFTYTKDESDPLKDKYGISTFIQSATEPSHRFQDKFNQIS